MKVIAEWFDANALRGHCAMILMGAVLCGLDIFLFDRMPNLTVAALITAVLIIPPFSLPAWGYDKSENKQKWIITFAISILFGCVFGLVFGKVTDKKLEEDFVSISGVAIFSVGVSVSLSFWTVGHMSREFIKSFTDFLAPIPEHLGKVISALYFVTHTKEGKRFYRPEQVLARNIILAILRFDLKEAEELINVNARESLLDEKRGLSEQQKRDLEHLINRALDELHDHISAA